MLTRNLNLFSLTPTIWTFSPLNPRHFDYGEVPIQLHGPRHIYIYISFNKYRTSFKKNNIFIIIKGNRNGFFTWAYVKKAYTYHYWQRRKKKLLIPFIMVNWFALISHPNNIPLIHSTTTNDNAALAIGNC